MITIKQILLSDIQENMILARDVIDQYDRVLLSAGAYLRHEHLELLKKHKVASLWVKANTTINHEITSIQELISNELKQKLSTSVQELFGMQHNSNIDENLHKLQSDIYNIVNDISNRKDVLMYLSNITYSSECLFEHSINVGLFSIAIGFTLNLTQKELVVLGMGGLLHDFGKIKLPKELLNKRGILTNLEYTKIKEHAAIGYNLLKKNNNIDHGIILIALQHHERYNGSGYPWGIVNSKINPLARIVAVADVYEALTTDRVYRAKLESYEAIKVINAGKCINYDGDVIEAFNKVAIPYYIGDEVMLNTGLKANVIKLNSANLGRPLVSTADGIVNLLCEPDIYIK